MCVCNTVCVCVYVCVCVCVRVCVCLCVFSPYSCTVFPFLFTFICAALVMNDLYIQVEGTQIALGVFLTAYEYSMVDR